MLDQEFVVHSRDEISYKLFPISNPLIIFVSPLA